MHFKHPNSFDVPSRSEASSAVDRRRHREGQGSMRSATNPGLPAQGPFRSIQQPQRRFSAWILPIVLSAYLAPLTALSQQNGPKVMVALAEQRPLVEETRLSGSVISPRIAKLSVQVSGLVESLTVSLGDRVRTGAEILRLDSELETLALTEAEAATEKVVEELADARRRLADSQKLSRSRAISADQIESLSSEVRADEAELRRIRAQQKRWEARLRRHRITAPFDGVISRKWTEIGEWLSPGDPVVELTAVSGLQIDFQAPQTVRIKLDQEAEILVRLDALPGNVYKGVINWVMPVADAQTRTFRLRATLQDEKASLAPGMSASAILRLRSGRQGITVPRDALIRHPDGRVTVWVAEHTGDVSRVSERRVETGLQFAGMVAITEGLSPGEWIVVQGNETLRDGQQVSIQERL